MKLARLALALTTALAVPAGVLLPAGTAAAQVPVVAQETFNDPADEAATHTVLCTNGRHATGGGASISNNEDNYISESFPAPNATGWTVTTAPINAIHDPRVTTVYVVCS
ncbi:hypothetical protein I5Q34_11085 [Streptomyces sp. AV19]|uniref:hypothetical protein n=1 Tax=Streptomyces sp. AV19 TaxID=2793068 RepID=UPI0018FE1093|nr:hypothetical protein [Streptomyces sp. AV19]MBH1934815.1 hypothetical protein [Streptomyces sp. AV19]MDG4530580.1 hypothetical protein [Streptomyces sp. AV19]